MANRKTVVTIVQLIVFLGLGIFIIYWMAASMKPEDKQEMLYSVKHVKLIYLIPVFIVGALSHYFRALRWRLLLEPLDIKPTRMNTFCAVMIGYLVNTVLPRFGEVAKCTVLAKYENVPADKMVGTIVAERAFDLLCLLIVLVIVFIAQYDIIGGYASDLFKSNGKGGHAGLYVFIGIVVVIALLLAFYKRIKRTKIGHAIKGIGDGVRTIVHLRHRRLFIIYTFAIWISYVGMIVLGFKALPATDHLSVLVALTLLGFGAIAMIVTPGGLGAYPGIISRLLLLFGIAKGDAIAFGWVSWGAQTGVIVVLGVLALILLPIYNRTEHDAQAGLDHQENIDA